MSEEQKNTRISENNAVKSKADSSVPKADVKTTEKYAVLQVRGLINVNHEVRDTLRMLNLQNQNQLVIIPSTSINKGMLKKCKDYITYGEVTEETIKALNDKRKTEKKYYCLHPPRGGFERKGIKKPFTKGGVLGYRGDKINALVQKML